MCSTYELSRVPFGSQLRICTFLFGSYLQRDFDNDRAHTNSKFQTDTFANVVSTYTYCRNKKTCCLT